MLEDIVELSDGARLRVRPLEPSDQKRLAEGFEHLSPRSRYSRFLSATPKLSTRQLAYLSAVDHHHHEALGASELTTGEAVGVARYFRAAERPGLAEVAVTVVDRWQRRGVGEALLNRLSALARSRGIERFSASVQAENAPMLRLLDRLGPFAERRLDRGTWEIEILLPKPEEAPRR